MVFKQESKIDPKKTFGSEERVHAIENKHGISESVQDLSL